MMYGHPYDRRLFSPETDWRRNKGEIFGIPPQHQPIQPGVESLMIPRPMVDDPDYRGSGKLKNKTVVVTGGDSGIGAAAAIAFGKEGADVVIAYYAEYENEDAFRTKRKIEESGRRCLLIPGDLKNERHCREVIGKAVDAFGKLDILVNNHAVQFPQNSLLDITSEQWDLTFKTNIYSFFYLFFYLSILQN